MYSNHFILLLVTFYLSPPSNSVEDNVICRSPKGCSPCTQAHIIDCSDAFLDTIPRFHPFNATNVTLTLNGNLIVHLTDACFMAYDGTMISLGSIDLSDNAINFISDRAFDGLQTSLRTLILHVNRITSFPTVSIQHLSALTTLILHNFNMNQLPTGALKSLGKLQFLRISSSNLTLIKEGDFSRQKMTLLTLDLSGNNLTSIPSNATANLTNLQTLILSENRIGSIQKEAFISQKNRLRHLNLSFNPISSIDKGTLDPLSSLTNLTLNNCRLTSMIEVMNLVQLQSLMLSNNRIVSIPSNVFIRMNKLAVLMLDHNEITSLFADSFNGLELSLQHLDLSNNFITFISGSPFRNFAILKTLKLDNQDLFTAVSKETFLGLEKSLQKLTLQKVNFHAEQLNKLQSLRSLETLSLRGNHIETIYENTFIFLNRIRSLDLSENKLTTVTPRQVHGMERSLREIFLESNQIVTIDECTFNQFSQLRLINVTMNPLICDCRLRWLRERMNENNDTSVAECAEPQISLLRQIDPEDLQCNNSSWTAIVCEHLPMPSDEVADSVTSLSNRNFIASFLYIQCLIVFIPLYFYI